MKVEEQDRDVFFAGVVNDRSVQTRLQKFTQELTHWNNHNTYINSKLFADAEPANTALIQT